MKKLTALLLLMVACIGSLAAKNDKLTTVQFTLQPPMHCQNCVDKINGNLRFEKGVKAIDPSLKEQVVTISYDPAKTDPTKLTAAFKKIGYTATEVKAPLTDGPCPEQQDATCRRSSSAELPAEK